MTDKDATDADALLALLDQWAKPPAEMVGKLPRVTCGDCSKRDRDCQKHKKDKCSVCGAWISTAHIHLDYLGHAETTLALIQADPLWSWEPLGWTDEGLPRIGVRSHTATMWGRLTVHGKSLLGVGSCAADKPDLEKELVGDFLRNAAMRFGVALSLWSKSEWEDAHVDPPTPEPVAGPEMVGTIKAAVALLEPEQRDNFKAWWKSNQLPPLTSGQLTDAQAHAVLDHLDSATQPGLGTSGGSAPADTDEGGSEEPTVVDEFGAGGSIGHPAGPPAAREALAKASPKR